MDVNGVYRHRQAFLQELLFVIDDLYKIYRDDHRLIDFNNNPKIEYSDINRVIVVVAQRLNEKLEELSCLGYQSESIRAA